MVCSFVFRDCSSLKNVIIPNNVSIIETCAFYRCKSLSHVKLLNDNTKIENDAFCLSFGRVEKPSGTNYSNHYRYIEEDYCPFSRIDYDRETWDALTDGQYGDYP